MSVPKKLVVEGKVDLYSIAHLMGHHTAWPDNKERAPVEISVGNGGEVLKPKYLLTKLKEPGLQALGIVLDADEHEPQNRYECVKEEAKSYFPELPANLPVNGLIAENPKRLRLGVWVMPDNVRKGDFELFLKALVPEEMKPAWKYAMEVVGVARGYGCSYKDSQVSKAVLYTWLAWQDEPGQSVGRALTRKLLDPHAESAAVFVKWFKELYRLPPI